MPVENLRYRLPEPSYDMLDRTHGGRKENDPTNSEIEGHVIKHYRDFYNAVLLDPSVDKDRLIETATERALAILRRENQIADVTGSREFQAEALAQKEERGPCALAISQCPDGGLPFMHIGGFTTSATETLAGIPPTYRSATSGKILLQSPWLSSAIARRAGRNENGQLLQILIAHSHCGRMGQIAAEAIEQGKPFGDPVTENLKLFEDPKEAITTTYNDARLQHGKDPLPTVAVTAVFDKASMSMTLGYGTDSPISSTDLLKHGLADKLVADLRVYQDPRLAAPGAFADNFLTLDTQIAREHLKTLIIKTLMAGMRTDRGIFSDAMHVVYKLDEYTSLTSEQKQALSVFFARQIARSFLGGQYLDGRTGKHIHADHHEIALAVSMNGSHSVGLYDPEYQIFGSSPVDASDAANHIVTKVGIMDVNPKGISHPYPLFISRTMYEGEPKEGGTEETINREVFGDFFHILQDERIAALVKSGKIAPVPLINTDQTHRIRRVVSPLVF